MALNKLQKLAGVSAVALGVAIAASDGWAYVAGSGDPEAVAVSATVNNTIGVTVTTDPAVGEIGVTNDGAEQATLIMAPDGSITEDTTGSARMLHSSGTGTPGVVDITGAFANTQLSVDFGNGADLACTSTACTGGAAPVLTLADATTDLATPGDLATPTTASGLTDGAGVMQFNIGVTLETPTSANSYIDGTYTGGFDLFFGY